MFEFTKQLPEDINEYRKIISIIIKEEINIIILCTNLFFEKYLRKDFKKPKIKNERKISIYK